jgi:hypothetical protein
MALLIGYPPKEPAHDLPIAAQPAMLEAIVGAIVRRVLVDDLYVADQPGTSVGPLDQIMAEQRITREAMLQHLVQDLNFIDALPGEDSLAVPQEPFVLRGDRLAALYTWRYFATYCNQEHNWLIPDNVQEEPAKIAARISPTNLGFLLNTRQVACEFGYLTIPEFAAQTMWTMDTVLRFRNPSVSF